MRTALRPVGGVARRARARTTPRPAGEQPLLPDGVVELDTLEGTFWFDGADEKLTPWIRSQATWEADVVRLLERTLRPGMVVVDVGANVGFHTVVAARAVGPRGHVYAVEPVPWTVEVLRANVWRHGCDEAVTILPVAAGAEHDAVELSIPAKGRSGTELAPLGSGGTRVRLEPLDDLVPAGPVDLLKIDVEGAELAVFAGAERLLEESPRLVAVVEFRPREPVAGTAPEAVLALYEGLGFELCALGRDGRPRPTTLHELARLDHETVNIVLRRPPRR